MGWLFSERRGPAWKHGWAEQTLGSVSAPPLPLLAICAIIFLLLTLSSYINYKLQMQQTATNLKLFLLLLPVVLIFAVQIFWLLRPRTTRRFLADHESSNLPLGRDGAGAATTGDGLLPIPCTVHVESKSLEVLFAQNKADA